MKKQVLFTALLSMVSACISNSEKSNARFVIEGTVEANLRTMEEEIQFVRTKADSVYKNQKGYWEAKFEPYKLTMIYIPEGRFTIGNDKLTSDVTQSMPASPAHKVSLTGYWIGRTPVTIGQFRMFVNETGFVTSVEKPGHEGPWVYEFEEKGFITIPGFHWDNAFSKVTERFPEVVIDDRHPVNCVSWYDSVAFCSWLSSKIGLNFKLPTEAEWEYAARGDDGRVYPWGNEEPDGTRANYAEEAFNAVFPNTGQSLVHFGVNDGYAATSPVGMYPNGASPFGALDMAGNLTEWVCDYLAPYQAKALTNPIGPSSGKDRAMKAGFWAASAGRFGHDPDEIRFGHNIRSDARQGDDPDSADDHLGFRVAIDYVSRNH